MTNFEVGDLIERQADVYKERFLVLKYIGHGYGDGELYHTVRFVSTDNFKTSKHGRYLFEYYPEFLEQVHIVSKVVP